MNYVLPIFTMIQLMQSESCLLIHINLFLLFISFIWQCTVPLMVVPVSYTHLDVYKRQVIECLCLHIISADFDVIFQNTFRVTLS